MLFTVLQTNYEKTDKRDDRTVIVTTNILDDAILEANAIKGDVRIKVDLDKKFGEPPKEFTPIHYTESIRQFAMRAIGLRPGQRTDPWHGLREYVGTAERAMHRAVQNKLPGAFRDYMMEIDAETREETRAPKTEAARADG